jgi:hypothetical protein
VLWPKSACVFCPYAGGASLPDTLARMRAHPDEAATALLLEAPAVALNPRSRLYGTHSLADRLTADGNTAALDLFVHQLSRRMWSVYDVRRIHLPAAGDPTRRGSSWRAVTPLHTGSPQQAAAWLRQHAPTAVDADGRAWIRHPDHTGYPQIEHFQVATLAGIAAKARPGFDTLWQRLTGHQPALFATGPPNA